MTRETEAASTKRLLGVLTDASGNTLTDIGGGISGGGIIGGGEVGNGIGTYAVRLIPTFLQSSCSL